MVSKVDLFVLVEMSAPSFRVRRWGRIQAVESEVPSIVEKVSSFDNVLFICKGRPPQGVVLYDNGTRAPVSSITRWTDLVDLNQLAPTHSKHESFLPWVLKKDTLVYIGNGIDETYSIGEAAGCSTSVRLKVASDEAKCAVLEVTVRKNGAQSSLKLTNLKEAFTIARLVHQSLELCSR